MRVPRPRIFSQSTSLKLQKKKNECTNNNGSSHQFAQIPVHLAQLSGTQIFVQLFIYQLKIQF